MYGEKRVRVLWITLLAAVVWLVGGCGDSDIAPKTLNQTERDQLSQKLSQHTEIFAKHGVQIQSSYTSNERIVIEVRQSQAPWDALTEGELDRLKQDLFQAVGYSFDVRIDTFVIPKQADITGTITALDGNRVLVVGTAEAGSNPNATWIKFPIGMTEELQIGYRINAWSDGMIEESYPSQTSGLQLQVVDFDVGNGRREGVITAVNLDDPNVENRSIDVDYATLRLLPFTKFLVNGEAGKLGNLSIGDKVQAWTLGYEIMTDVSFASQINELTSP